MKKNYEEILLEILLKDSVSMLNTVKVWEEIEIESVTENNLKMIVFMVIIFLTF